MPFVSGTYQRFYGSTGWTDDKNAAVFILASRHDTHDQDIADGINTAVGKIRLGDTMILSSVSGTNTVLGSLTPALTAYAYGLRVILTPANTNTGATTLNINSLGALAVLNTDGTACIGGELVATMPAELMLNSAANGWIIVNPNVLRSRGVEAGPIDLIQRVVTVNDTAVIGDRGRCIAYNGAGGHTQTLPSNLFTIGTILVLKNANTVNWSVAASGTLIWYNGSGAFPTGTRTLAGGAWATAHHTSATTWDFTGTGVS